jgi:DNA end-binding protein Ku
MGYAAIAQVTLHQRERTVVIRPYKRGLALHTIFYPNEIHVAKEYEQTDLKELKKQEISLGEQFAETLVKPFRPQEFHDEYQARVKQLIDSKSKGQSIPKQEHEKKLAPVIDLMSALKKSLETTPAVLGLKRVQKQGNCCEPPDRRKVISLFAVSQGTFRWSAKREQS